MRKKILSGFLCMILFMTSIVPTGMQVQASELPAQKIAVESGLAVDETETQEQEEDSETPKDGEEESADKSEGDTTSEKEKDDDTDEDVTEETEEEESEAEESEAEESETEESETEESEEEIETEEGEEPEEDGQDTSEAEKEVTELKAVTMESQLMTSGTDIASGSYDSITWVIDADGKLTVEGSGEINHQKWNSYKSKVISAEINVTGATSASGMFQSYSNLESVDLSKFDTSQVTDMSYMFYGCSSLESLNLSTLDTSQLENMSYMFTDCSSLESLNLSELNTEKVTDMSHLVQRCSSLTDINLNGLNTAQVTNMAFMFSNCTSLKSLDLRGLDTSRVTNMSYMFSMYYDDDNNNLTSVNLSGLNTSQVTNMSYMFIDCSKLVDVNLSGLDTSKVINMSYMFSDCSSLIELDLSKLNTGQVTNMRGLFSGCSSLTSLNLMGLDTRQVTDMASMFINCSSLTELDLSSFDTGRVKCMVDMFSRCSNLNSLDLSDFNTSQVSDEYGFGSMFYGCSNLTELDLSGFDVSQINNMSMMFYGCKSLTDLDLSDFGISQATDMSYMFADCSALENLNLGNLDTSQEINMNEMFRNCSSLTSLDLSGFDNAQPTDMTYTFHNCSNLESVDLSGLKTGKEANLSQMFYGCSNLSDVDMTDMDLSKVTSMSGVFDGCSNLTTLDLSCVDISQKEQINGIYSMITGCTNLDTIYTPCNLTQYINLPTAKSDDVWYCPDGTTTTYLPQFLVSSSILMKNKVPTISNPYITVTKTKTDYECGDTINTDDLTVTYYNNAGVPSRITQGYTTNVDEIDMSTPGKKILIVTYQWYRTTVELTVAYHFKADGVTITLPITEYTYNGREKKPVPEVTLTASDTKLTADKDYTVSYENNIGAGTEAKVIITGQNDYSGTFEQYFTIKPAEVTITAKDLVRAIGEPLPGVADYKYSITGLCGNDKLSTEPTLTCAVSDMSKTGTYSIIPSGADAGSNYTISYREGTLTVAEERVVYTVSFDLRGHGTDIQPLTGIKAGSLIDEPAAPTAEGYTFGGWYKDKACTKAWSFATETIQEDVTLYACWTVGTVAEDDYSLRIQEIPDQIYSGSALKPAVRVYAADGSTLLKAGKDYTIQYYNSTEADTEEEESLVSVCSTGEEEEGFTKDLAYAVITGKGNYKDTVYRNFHILPACIGEGGANAAEGITLKYTDQLTVNAKKAQKPFSSLKYKKNMAAGKDIRITLTAVNAFAADGTALEAGQAVDAGNTVPAIPAGYKGTFCMKIEGLGNYTGSIEKEIHVADKSYLIKNVSISLGKNQKKLPYLDGEEVTLTPGYYDAGTKKYYKAYADGTRAEEPEANGNDLFTVKYGKTYLVYGKDYTVSYTNNQAVGTATMTIMGIGDYSGSKSVSFAIAGAAFSTKNVVVGNDFKASMAYTGRPLTQNGVTLTTKAGEPLTYGEHYTIRYKNNLKKGTATMQFVAKPESGYSGSFNKTFKITAPDLKEAAELKLIGAQSGDKLEGTDGIYTLKADIPYSREGTKPAERISLVSRETGAQLKEGTDYTVSYTNNKAVTTPETAANKLPVMTIKGKGNYAGSLKVTFSISEAAFEENGNVTITATPIALNAKKADGYQYQPKVKVTDGKQTLKEKKDYTVVYQNCKQAEVKAYQEALVAGSKTAEELENMRPKAVVTALKGSGYLEGESRTVDLEIYQTKLATSNLYVVISQENITYTGAQLKPEVTVYYGSSKAVSAAKKAKETDEEVLTGESATYQLIKLNPDTDGTGDYHVSYGANVAAGKNKGTVTVTGTGLYGGSVTTKFDIISRKIY